MPSDKLIHVKPVLQAPTVTARMAKSVNDLLPPGDYASCNQWALDNRVALVAYAECIAEHGTAARQLYEFLADAPE